MNEAILTTSSIEQHCWKQDGCRVVDCCEKLAGSERSAGSPDQLFQPHCCEAVFYTTLQTDRQMDHRIVYGQDRLPQLKLLNNYCSRKVARSTSICICKWRRKCRQFPPITQLLQRRRRAWLVSPSIGLHRNFTTDPPEYHLHNHSEKLITARLLS